MIGLLTEIGFIEVRITDRFDCFCDTSKEEVAMEFTVWGVNLFARRPASYGINAMIQYNITEKSAQSPGVAANC